MEAPFTSTRGLCVERYRPERAAEWDRFVDAGKNATFLFRRGYMDYHADRFADHSLMVRKGAELVAVLPANLRSDGTVASHQGLTYGGFVLQRDECLHGALDAIHAALQALEAAGVPTLLVKRLPRFYNTLPDDEIDYAAFLLGARLVRRDTAIVVSQQDRLPIRRGKRSQINKGRRAGVRVAEDSVFAPYWNEVLSPRLMARYGVRPVHSLEEIELLRSRFPDNIRQFSAYLEDRIVAGITIYETPTVAHVQYSAINPEGEPVSALDVLLEWLILERYAQKRFFDFGICNEEDGRALNHRLLQSKEGFGARACVHDFLEIRCADHESLGRTLAGET